MNWPTHTDTIRLDQALTPSMQGAGSIVESPAQDRINVIMPDGAVTLSKFGFVYHYTFVEAQARVTGTYHGNPVSGTLVYSHVEGETKTEYYGTGGEDLAKVLCGDKDVLSKFASMVH